MPHLVEPGSIFSSRYVIHGLIGEGGMATVYRALDQERGTPVAVKVLRRELAQAVGAERFAREVDIASTMEHPNVVSLIDAGTSGEWLYCVMPLFEGETLRDRLDREGQLPIEDALVIADAVAQGLDYAHERGIVHRDVKPENILLSGDNVGLADFGIARAVVQAEEGNRLTSTGIVIGTPTYMSPEQAAADKVDGRADIYALGCVLYEMLSGGEPFTAPTAQGLLARHVRDPVPDVRTVRPGTPDPVWFAIQKAMAKSPADRFKTAGEFIAATKKVAAPKRRDWRKAVVAAIGVAAVAVAVILVRDEVVKPGGTPLVDSLVAVLPFSLQAPDSSDRWLASAIPMSIAPLLEGTAGLTAVSERRIEEALASLDKSWADHLTPTEASEVARRAGAGAYLIGDVQSGGGERGVLARLYDTRTGEELMDPVRVRLDSLGPVTAVERIYGQILITLVGEDARAGGLSTRSSSALRSYVDGVTARREERHVDASRSFLEALRADSAFALAGLGFLESLMWLPDGSRYLDERRPVELLTLANEQSLSERDRALLDGIVATYARFRYDSLTVSGEEALAILRRGVVEAADNPSSWLLLGDFLLHDGAMLDYDDHVDMAIEQFDSAMAKGNPWSETIRHLNEIRFVRGDTAFIREYTRTTQPNGVGFDPLWWGGIWLLGDTAAIREFEASMASLPRTAYPQIMVWAQRLGVGLTQADRAAELLRATSTVHEDEVNETEVDLLHYYVNRGRLRLFYDLLLDDPDLNADQATAHSFFWFFGGMHDWLNQDSLRAVVGRALPGLAGAPRRSATCALGQWHSRWGDSAIAVRMMHSLEQMLDAPSTNWHLYERVCLRLIRAAWDTSASMAALRGVDSLLSGQPPGGAGWTYFTLNLALAELYEARGAYADALRLSKRVRFLVTEDQWHTPALVMEGRLSLAVGDTTRAIEAISKAITLLMGGDPPVERVVQEMRETLSELLAQ